MNTVQEGLSLITRGMAGIRATGAVTGTPNLLMMLAGAYAAEKASGLRPRFAAIAATSGTSCV